MYEPALHKPVPMDTRVRIPAHYLGKPAVGTVVGVSSVHVIFTYIVLLDEAVSSEYGKIRALSINGAELDSEDGMTNWRLNTTNT